MWVTWVKTKEIAEFVSYVSVIAAIGIATAEYFSGSARSRVDRSMQYLAGFRSSEMRMDRDRIERPWRRYDMQRLSNVGANRPVLEALAKGFAENDPEFRASLVHVVETLDEIGICVRNRICDPDILQQQVGPYVKALTCLYGKEIETIRAEMLLPRIGRDMVSLSNGESC